MFSYRFHDYSLFNFLFWGTSGRCLCEFVTADSEGLIITNRFSTHSLQGMCALAHLPAVLLALLLFAHLGHSIVLSCTTSLSITQSGVHTLGSCTVAASISINVPNVELYVTDSKVSSITAQQGTNLWISLTRTTVTGLFPVLSGVISNYTVLLDGCTVDVTSAVDALYLTRAAQFSSVTSLSMVVRSSTIRLVASSTGSPSVGLIAIAGSLTQSNITIEHTSITVTWTGSSALKQGGSQANVNLVWLSGGGSSNHIGLHNVSASLGGSGNNIVVLVDTQILSDTRISAWKLVVIATGEGPRLPVAFDTDGVLNAVSRETSLVVLESGGGGNNVNVTESSLSATLKQSPVLSTSSQAAMMDTLLAFLVRFVCRDGTIYVASSALSTSIPKSVGGLVGLLSVAGSGAVASLILNPTGGVSGVTLRGVRIVVSNVAVNVVVAENAFCGYRRTMSLMGYPLTTSNAGAVLLVGLVSVGMESNNVSIQVSSSSLAYTPPKYSLCPNEPTSSVVAIFTFTFPMPSTNTTILSSVILGSPVDLLITMVRVMFTGLDNTLKGFGKDFLKNILPPPPVPTGDSVVLVRSTAVYTDFSGRFPIFGSSLSGTWYAAVVTALKIRYTSPLQMHLEYNSAASFIPALLVRTIELGYTTGITNIVIDQPTQELSSLNPFVPSVVLIDNITDVVPTQQRKVRITISRLSAVMTVPNGYVFTQDLTAALEWIFYRIRWNTSFVFKNFGASNYSVATAPLVKLSAKQTIPWPTKSTLFLRCVFCNSNEVVGGPEILFGSNASVVVAPSSAVGFRECEMTNTPKYVTKTKPLPETATHELTLSIPVTKTSSLTPPPFVTPTRMPTLTIDPNLTIPPTDAQVIDPFESTVVVLSLVGPLLPATGSLQRSFGLLRISTRCSNIDKLRIGYRDGDPLMSAVPENPLRLSLASGFVDNALSYVGGGIVGNVLFVVICVVFVVAMFSLWNCFRRRLRERALSIRLADISIGAAFVGYAGLLQPSLMGAVGSIALAASALFGSCCIVGNIVMGVGSGILWLLPTFALAFIFFGWDDADAYECETLRIVGEQVNRRITRAERRRRQALTVANWTEHSTQPDKGKLGGINKTKVIRWLCGETIAVLPADASLSHRVLLVTAGWPFRPGFHWYLLFMLLYQCAFGACVGILWWSPETGRCQKGLWALLALVAVSIGSAIIFRPFRSQFDLLVTLTLDVSTCIVIVLAAIDGHSAAEIVSQLQTVFSLFALFASAIAVYFRTYHERESQPESNLLDEAVVEEEYPCPRTVNLTPVGLSRSIVCRRPQLHDVLLASDPPSQLRPFIFVEEWHALKITSITHTHLHMGTRFNQPKHIDYKHPLEALGLLVAIISRIAPRSRATQPPPHDQELGDEHLETMTDSS